MNYSEFKQKRDSRLKEQGVVLKEYKPAFEEKIRFDVSLELAKMQEAGMRLAKNRQIAGQAAAQGIFQSALVGSALH